MRVSEEGEPSRCQAFRGCRPSGRRFRDAGSGGAAHLDRHRAGGRSLSPPLGEIRTCHRRNARWRLAEDANPERRREPEPHAGVGFPTTLLGAPGSVALTPSPSGPVRRPSPTLRSLRGQPEAGRAAPPPRRRCRAPGEVEVRQTGPSLCEVRRSRGEPRRARPPLSAHVRPTEYRPLAQRRWTPRAIEEDRVLVHTALRPR